MERRARLVMTVSCVAVVIAGWMLWQGARWFHGQYDMPKGDCTFLETLRVENAEADADKTIAAGELRLLGVYSYSLEVPGAPNNHRQSVKPIECTGDVWLSAKHIRLVRAADIYAERYNRRVLKRSGG